MNPQLSTNRNTVRDRQRVEAMSDEQHAQLKKRKAENAVRTRLRKKLKESTDGWDELDKAAQEALVDQDVLRLQTKQQNSAARKLEQHEADPPAYLQQVLAAIKRGEFADDDDPAWEVVLDTEEIVRENALLEQGLQPLRLGEPSEQTTVVTDGTLGMRHIYVDKPWARLSNYWCKKFVEFADKVDRLEGAVLAETTDDGSLVVPRSKGLIRLAGLAVKPTGNMHLLRRPVLARRIVVRGVKTGHGRTVFSLEPKKRIVNHRRWLNRQASIKRQVEISPTVVNREEVRLLSLAYERGSTVLPHMIFNEVDRAIFRNVASWDPKYFKGDMVKLPGPAWLWPDSYDLESHGFMPDSDGVIAEKLYKLMLNYKGKAQPPLGNSVYFSDRELRWKGLLEMQEFEKDYMRS